MRNTSMIYIHSIEENQIRMNNFTLVWNKVKEQQEAVERTETGRYNSHSTRRGEKPPHGGSDKSMLR